jgi:ATP-dependent helicase IRC3
VVPVIALYPFQAEALAAIETAVAAGQRRLLLAWATGLGKTVAFAHVLARRPGRALVLAHRDELLAQAVAKLQMVMPAAAIGVVQGPRDERTAPLVVASVQTLSRRRRLAGFGADFVTVVVDEAHHAPAASYQRILEHVGTFNPDGPLLLGVTATPYRADGAPLGRTFERVVHQVSILDGILGGYLCDLEARRLRVDANLDAIPTHAGDLDEGATETALLEARSESVIAEALCQYAAARRQILVFTTGVRLAHAVAAATQARGLTAEALDGRMALEDRRALLARFAAGTTQVVANCAVLTEGFDEPGISCIVMARPTKSRGLYTQMLGRGTRRHFGKASCLILDLVGVGQRFDLVTMPNLLIPPAEVPLAR